MGGNKDMCNNSNESIRSEFTISFRRFSTGVTEVDHSPTFPHTWKSFQHLTGYDSTRPKRYTVAAFPSNFKVEETEFSSSESDDQITAYLRDHKTTPLAKESNASVPKRNRFSSGYIFSWFLKRQTLVSCEGQQSSAASSNTAHEKQVKNVSEEQTAVNCETKMRRIQKINSAPNIRTKPAQNTKGIMISTLERRNMSVCERVQCSDLIAQESSEKHKEKFSSMISYTVLFACIG